MRVPKQTLPKLQAICVVGLIGLFCDFPRGEALLAQQAGPQAITIPDGTLIPLYLMDGLSSKTNKSDDPVRFKVREDVRINGKVVIPWNSPGLGKVAIVGGRGLAGKAGSVNFTVEYVTAVDGSKVRVRGAPTIKGGGNTSVAAASAVAFGPAALLVMRGAHAEIRKGTMLSVYVDGERQVTLGAAPGAQTAAPSGQAAAQPAATPATPRQPVAAGGLAAAQTAAGQSPAQDVASDDEEDLSTVIVKSTPAGGDVTLDGRFVGSTPSTLQLKPGDHTIVVEKDGFVVWKRTLTVRPGGIVNVDARLEAAK